jgi:S1-C subfamily serine protease
MGALFSACAPHPGSLEAATSPSAYYRNIVGIEISNMMDTQRVATKYAGPGVYVSAVIPNHPAYLAGLKAGDIITSINSIPVSNISEALSVMSELEAGRRYPFRICRIRTKAGEKSFGLETVIFTVYVLIEKIQERAIGRVS